MNRHIIPSMLLSVLIVVFFAVILFERDRPHRPRGTDQAVTGKKPGETHVKSAAREQAASPDTAPVGTGKPKPAEEKQSEAAKQLETAQATAMPVKEEMAGESSAGKHSGAANQESPSGGSQAVFESATAPASRPAPLPAREAATRIPDHRREENSPVKTMPSEPSAPSGPQQAFTSVRQGESLRDVAIRVYGSADELDSLWCANRDVLPQKDSLPAAGSVLRTPTNKHGD